MVCGVVGVNSHIHAEIKCIRALLLAMTGSYFFCFKDPNKSKQWN